MADQDNASKTEEPTARRLEKGRERGQVAVSIEVKNFAMLAGSALVLALLIPPMARDLVNATIVFLDSPDAVAVDPESVQVAMARLALATAAVVAPPIAVLFVIGIVAGIAQVGFLWAPSKIAVKAERLSPLAGFKRLFGPRAFVEFAKGMVKLVIVSAVSFGVAWPLLADLALTPMMPVAAVLQRLDVITLRMVAAAAAAMAIIAGLDHLYQRFTFSRDMRMTKEEVKDEHRQSEGDPHVKARIRKLRQERARRRMMAAVPEADVVVTNPTHYAVALAYKMGEMAAPKVVAKGVDHLARRIREVAAEHRVPIVENPPVARALYASVDLDEEIPAEHYQAVAQIIGYVMRLKGRMAWN